MGKKRKNRRKRTLNVVELELESCELCDIELEQQNLYKDLLDVNRESIVKSEFVRSKADTQHGHSKDIRKYLVFFKQPVRICGHIERIYPSITNRDLIKYLLHFKSHVRLSNKSI